MNTAHILNLTRHPELLNRETLYELRNCLSRYPYFTTARILYLHNLYLLRESGFNEELKLAALQVNDRSRLFQIIEGHKYAPITSSGNDSTIQTRTSPPKEDSAGQSRTLDLINQFLSQQPEKETLVSFDLTADYTTYLLEEKEDVREDDSPTHVLIDSYLNLSPQSDEQRHEEEKKEEEATSVESAPEFTEKEFPTPSPDHEEEPQKEETSSLDESFFTETLAKIYIKQGRYDKALEIIKNIYLKNPKKSAYFADQIRFLEKLIINSK